jgi:hypothetical protein
MNNDEVGDDDQQIVRHLKVRSRHGVQVYLLPALVAILSRDAFSSCRFRFPSDGRRNGRAKGETLGPSTIGWLGQSNQASAQFSWTNTSSLCCPFDCLRKAIFIAHKLTIASIS